MKWADIPLPRGIVERIGGPGKMKTTDSGNKENVSYVGNTYVDGVVGNNSADW